MARRSRRPVAWIVVGVLALAAVVAIVLLLSRPALVQVTHPRTGTIASSFTEPARTRLAETWPVTMPIAGRIGRIALKPGDKVTKGQELAAFDVAPFDHAVTEAQAAIDELEAQLVVKRDNRVEQTSVTQSQAMVKAANEALNAAAAQVDAEQANATRASKELKRIQSLAQHEAVAQSQLDDAQLAADTALIGLREKQFSLAAMRAMISAINLLPKVLGEYIAKKGLEEAVLEHQLAQARARLAQAKHERGLAQVVSPITGLVLERYELGDQALEAGRPLLLLGNLDQLEVIADVLTEDALKLKPGETPVRMSAGPGMPTFNGHVRRVEPQGFTKRSSLGVEQQRVNVIVAFEGEAANLGVGYRLQATFITARRENALIIPRFTLLQTPEDAMTVFVVENGVLRRRTVKLGLTSDVDVQVVSGLTPDDLVVLHPDTTMEEGTRVRAE